MKTLYLIHHSHTDIGYTNRQETIRRYHVGFIRQALAILERRGLDCGFRWQCETFWGVEQFLAEANEYEKIQLADAIRAGSIGLSANYANFSEILSQDVLEAVTARASHFSNSIDYPLRSAMTADINGFGWGFCKALYTNGITNLFTCIHTHHGMFPLERHRPFWWSGPDDSKILVWNGEHYHFGNELGLAPGAVSSYITKDECDAETIYHDPWKVAEIRIPRLFEQLAKDEYPYDFLPVMISGLRTDNGPPSEAILDQVNRWNDAHGEEFHVEMVTLDQFFERLRSESIEIPTYHGDWPDWWTDGVASMPDATALFREAQRTWGVVKQLRKYPTALSAPTSSLVGIGEHAHDIHVGDDPHLQANTGTNDHHLISNLAIYAEHTYGHAASIVQPYHPMVNALAARKASYATLADEQAQSLLLDELGKRGQPTLAAALPFRYQVINPHPVAVTSAAELQIEHHEYYEKNVYRGIRVVDEATGDELPAGTYPTAVTTTLLVPLTLEPGEQKTLRIEPTMTREITPDEGRPTLEAHELTDSSGVFETDAFRIEWQTPEGITSWVDKDSGNDLLRPDRDHNPFIPVYSLTPMASPNDSWSVRSAMGLSRSGKDAEWSVGKVTAVRERHSGAVPGDPVVDKREDNSTPMYRRLEFDLEVAGCEECSLILEAVAGLQDIQVSFNVNKQNRWAPENLYLSLPFGSSPTDTVWLDKSGDPLRARIDQLSGSLIDFYSVQNGFVVESEQSNVTVAMKDNPLLQLGPLEFQEERVLHDANQPHPDRTLPYAWLMSNYWETNFAAGLGGFHSFRFHVSSFGTTNPQHALEQLQSANSGLLCFRIMDDA
jgi:Glycosyl hydrolases family 38 N-terminal domain